MGTLSPKPQVSPAATVYLVDDDPSVLRSTGRLVSAAGWNVILFSSPREFLQSLRRDVIGCAVLDLNMPGLNGIELQRALAEAGHPLPVIFLTGKGDIPTTVRAMKAGAVEFLTKPCGSDELLAAIRVAIARDLKQSTERAGRRALVERFDALTPREHEVMLGVIVGKMNKEIAAELGIAEITIKVHRGRVMQKLEVLSIAELVRLTEQAGISPEPP